MSSNRLAGRLTRCRRGRRERGSIAVELVATIPILVGVAMVLAQALAMVAGLGSVNRAARDAARAAGDANSAVSAQRAAEDAVPSWVHITAVRITQARDTTSATVEAKLVYGISGVLSGGGVDVSRSAEMPRIRAWG